MKKIFCIILTFMLTVQSIIFKPMTIFADSVNQNVLNQKYSKSPRVGFVLPIASSLGSVALGKLMSIFLLGITATSSSTGGVLNLIYNLAGGVNKNDVNIMNNLKSIIEKANHVTQAFIVAYGNFTKSTGKIAEDVRKQLLEYYQESFIVGIEKALSEGVNFETLKKYGVTNLFTLDNINKLASGGGVFSYPSINATTGVCSVGISSSRRLVPFKKANGDYASQYMAVPMGLDIDMSVVKEVDVIMLPLDNYNYGWEASNFVQVYKMQVGSKFYEFRVSIVKSLSPNQRVDSEIDGLGFGFYEVDSMGKIITDSPVNCYRVSSSKIDANYIPTVYGTDLFHYASTSPTGVAGVNFGKLRSICADVFGKDIFAHIPNEDVYNFWDSTLNWVTGRDIRITDYSKANEGKYNNKWEPIGGVINIPDMGGQDVYFPQTWEPGAGADVDFPYDNTKPIPVPEGGVVSRPGDFTSNPGISFPNTDVLNPPYVGDTDVPDVDVPDTDIPGTDNPDIDIPDNPGIDVPDFPNDIPPFQVPGLDIKFNPIDFTPIINIGDTLKSKFPFSLPFDFYNIINTFLNKSRESARLRNLERAKYLGEDSEVYAGGNAPIFKIPMPGSEQMYLDFSMFNPVAEVVRIFVAIGYSICLVLLLRKVIN